MIKNTPSVQKDKSWRTVAEMLVADVILLVVLALVISQLIRFPCVTPPASTWSLAIGTFFFCHLICRFLSEPIKDYFVNRNTLAQLRHKVIELFNDDEVRNLCFDLGVDYDNLPGNAKPGKVRELIIELDRRQNISKLFELCRKERPDSGWDSVFIGSPLVELREFIVTNFDAQELRTLCFDLSVNHKSPPATVAEDKARELITSAYLDRRIGISALTERCRKQHPEVGWDAVVESSVQADATEIGSKRDNPVVSLLGKVHPGPEILPDLWLGVLTVASIVGAAALVLSHPWPFTPIEPTPSIESFSVRYPGQPASRGSDAIEVFEGDQVEIEAILRGSASTLCTWFAEKGTRHPAEGCATLYSAPFGETSDVLNVKVQSLCKTREAYSGLSVIVKTR